jgi:hypothetical protein
MGIAGRWQAVTLIAVSMMLLAFACLVRATPSSEVEVIAPIAGSHLGASSCTGSTCHGRQEATGAIVRQDELKIWQDDSSPAGAHSRAWQVLAEPRAQAIGAKLGIGDPRSAPTCLGCHSDVMAGGGFHRSDGVGCEACHGGAKDWLASHYAVGASHAQNLSRGMVPLDQPRARAAVCLDCHYGSARPDQFVDHRIMAAGHPRLDFELDLFSTMEKHWNEDAAYVHRQHAPSAAILWAVGQAQALDRALTLYASPARGQEGAFPEFYFFDCQSCHRRISDAPDFRPSALANPGRALPLGTPPFQDENMIMLTAAARIVAPDLATRLSLDSLAFHRALTQGREPAVSAGMRLRETARLLAERFSGAPIGPQASFAMIAALADAVTVPRYTDYEGSTQAVMAIDTLLSGLTDSGAVSRAAAAGIRLDIDRAYAAVKNPNSYQPLVFREAIAHAAGAIGALK